MVRATYACLDGSPFPVVYATADDASDTWFLDREHAPEAMTPLADAVRPAGQPGEAQAYEECGVALLPSLRRARPVANGFAYHLVFDPSPEQRDQLGAELVDLARRHGGTAGVWAEGCLPSVRADCSWLRDAPVDTSFAALAARREHAWGLTSVAGLVARLDEQAVAAACAPVVGDRATDVAYLLAQGFANETIDADRSLVHLAGLEPDSDEHATERAVFLADYGGRSTSWSIDHPTFGERPDLLDAQLRLLRREGTTSAGPDDAGERRARLAGEIAAALDDDSRARFRRRLLRLEAFVPVREARARWQLVASGAMRAAVRRRAAHLVALGVIDDVDDAFFLTPTEYDGASGDRREAVAARRADHAHWSSVVPPPSIGGTTPVAPHAPDDRASGAVVTGIGGSPGTVTGPARVIRDLGDVERLQPDDVLVTTMTSPAWTPLFAVAGAVVTDAGDALSHVAIAAREYGIPSVAGTHHATAVITDGALVTVDGGAGTVHLA